MVGTEAFADYEAQMALLRDRVLVAIAQGASGQVVEGLALYRRLARETLLNYRRLETSSGTATATFPSSGDSYGDEWRILLRDLYDFAEAIVLTPSTRIWVEFCSFFFSVAVDATEITEVAATSAYWDTANIAWRGTLNSRRVSQGDQEALLLRLRDFALIGAGRARNVDVGNEVRMLAAVAFVRWIKSAIDAGDEESGLLCLRYFDYAFTPRHDRDQASDRVATFVLACVLELLAWLLLARQEERVDASLDRLHEGLREVASRRNSWLALRALQLDEFDRYLQSQWWELTGPGPVRSGFLQLSHFELLASLGTRLLPPDPDAADGRDADLARRLLGVLAARETSRGEEPRLSGVRARLQKLVDQDEESKKQWLIEAPLEPERVQSFVDSLSERFAASRLDRLLLMVGRQAWRDGVSLEEVPAFGWDGLVPKSFFVTEPNVVADPIGLANDIAAALTSGEEAQVLRALHVGKPVQDVHEIGHLAGVVAALRDDLGAVSEALIVTNSWQAVEALVPIGLSGNQDILKTRDGVTVFRLYTNDPPFLVLLDADGGVVVERAAVDKLLPADEYHEEPGLLIGVAPLRTEDLDELITRIEEDAQAARRLELLASTRVRVLERFRVRVVDQSRIRHVLLPDNAW